MNDEAGRATVGEALDDLVAVMGTLRVACTWDRIQTHASLRRHLLEESYETFEALDRIAAAEAMDHATDHATNGVVVDDDVFDDLNDDVYDDLCEELGDVLFQVVFHAHLAAEADRFDLSDVIDGVRTKLVDRHPAIFSTGAGDELDWERAKVVEKARTSVMDGIPSALPALAYAAKVVTKTRIVAPDVVAAVIEGGGRSLGSNRCDEAAPVDEAALGQVLLAVVAAARNAGLDPEAALRTATRDLEVLVRAAEASPTSRRTRPIGDSGAAR